jgi:hypothetical protein
MRFADPYGSGSRNRSSATVRMPIPRPTIDPTTAPRIGRLSGLKERAYRLTLRMGPNAPILDFISC